MQKLNSQVNFGNRDRGKWSPNVEDLPLDGFRDLPQENELLNSNYRIGVAEAAVLKYYHSLPKYKIDLLEERITILEEPKRSLVRKTTLYCL